MIEDKVTSFGQIIVDVDSLVEGDVTKILRKRLAYGCVRLTKFMLDSPPNTVPKSHERS